MITSDQLLQIDIALHDILKNQAGTLELLGWSLTIFKREGDRVSMVTFGPQPQTVLTEPKP